MDSRIEVFPHPDGPNNAEMPPSTWKETSNSNPDAYRCRPWNSSIVGGLRAAAQPPADKHRRRGQDHAHRDQPPAFFNPAGALRVREYRQWDRLRFAWDVSGHHDLAPNSPTLRANANTAPAITPRDANGKLTRKNVRNGPLPRDSAARSNRGSTPSNANRIARTINGNATTPAASAAPHHEKNDLPTEGAFEKTADGTVPSEQHQQHEPGHDRRQHQRQRHDGLDDPSRARPRSRQPICHAYAGRQRY
jgi:hypothetical protein